MPTTPYCQPGSSCCCSAARGLALLALFLLACSGEAPARDWRADPALLELDAVPLTYAISDIHGGYDRLVALLLRHQLLRAAPPSPDQAEWSAGRAVLVVTGDLFDSGPAGVEVLDLLRALQARASEAGGRVVVTLGNHEAEFLVSANNKKATAQNGISTQLVTRGLQPSEVAQGLEARGRWLRALPFATRIGRWFFSHAGDTHGRSTAALSAALQQGVDLHDYDDAEIVGDTSLLQSADWTSTDKTIGARYAQAAGAAHLVFGHNPSALGTKGQIGHAQSGALFRIDCGMSPDIDYSQGALLRVELLNGDEIAAALESDGKVRELWRGPLP